MYRIQINLIIIQGLFYTNGPCQSLIYRPLYFRLKSKGQKSIRNYQNRP
uniref:Uncharacterized protein n=1 Tax=Ligilactobacillus acidipiscis TaxID=89059 RepID=A0A285PNR8_9LACO|nr:hypothetical protein PLAC3_P14 [Ligilactobacillus acidipiscis]SPM00137.1 hypothetical protein PLAC03_P14 [Ligilactobacillus acidipiscis]